MWYHGRDGSGPHPEYVGCGNIGLATSNDGVVWRRGSQARPARPSSPLQPQRALRVLLMTGAERVMWDLSARSRRRCPGHRGSR